MAPIPQMIVGGIPVALVSRSDILSIVVGDCSNRRKGAEDRPEGTDRRAARLLFSANGHALSLAAREPEFRAALHQADLVHADGQALVFASRFAPGQGIPERSATTDLIHDMSPRCAAEGLSFFLLGGTEDVNARCAETLVRMYPGLRIAGRRDGYFTSEEEQQVCAAIGASGADILWVGLGKPLEQLFCVRNRHRLHVAWAITCGGSFRFVTGDYRRAPRWMQAAGLEWLFRALSNPRRLLWRYLTTNPHAVFLLATRTRRAPVPPGRARWTSWYRDPKGRDTGSDGGKR